MSNKYYYVYILESESHAGKHYTGFTKDVHERLEYHNSGLCPHTVKYRPWRLKVFTAFSDKEKAMEYERYLKSHSGRAFASKHY